MEFPKRLVLHGSHRNAGLAHGEILRDQIHSLFDIRMRLVEKLTQAGFDRIQEICETIAKEIESILPSIFIEISATSLAANLDLWKLILAGGFSDVVDKCGLSVPGSTRLNECTLIASRDSHGELILIGTWDSHCSAQGALIAVERRIDKGPTVIALSTAGWPMQQGVTEYGLAFAIANLCAKQKYDGVTYISALPDIVERSSARAALARAAMIPHCSGRFYKFVDEKGEALGLEHEGRLSFEVNGFEAHTNHFVSQQGRSFEGRPHLVEESNGRRNLMNSLFRGRRPTIEGVFDLLGKKNSDDFLISKHGEDSEDRTCAAFVISPKRRTIWFTAGPPLLDEIQELNMSASTLVEDRS